MIVISQRWVTRNGKQVVEAFVLEPISKMCYSTVSLFFDPSKEETILCPHERIDRHTKGTLPYLFDTIVNNAARWAIETSAVHTLQEYLSTFERQLDMIKEHLNGYSP